MVIVYFGQFIENYIKRPQFGATFSTVYKNGLGHILGDFFANSSGHPGCDLKWVFGEWLHAT
jgi:hypothetical protein